MTARTRKAKEARRAEKVERLSARAELALDALEGMVTQHFADEGESAGGDTMYGHEFLKANEDACDVLAQLRPDWWRLTASGIMHVDGEDLPDATQASIWP